MDSKTVDSHLEFHLIMSAMEQISHAGTFRINSKGQTSKTDRAKLADKVIAALLLKEP